MTDQANREAQLQRIRALLARTTANGCTEAEAQAAAAMVDKLLAAYEIDLDEVSVRSQHVVQYEVEAVRHAVRHAAVNIGLFCDCKVWTHRDTIVFLGLELDTEVAEYLVLLFMRAIDRGAGEYTVFNADYALGDRVKQANMVLSFKVGMATRLGERLAHLKSSRDFTQRSGGFDLVLSKGALVQQAFATLGISLGKGSAGASIGDRGAYQAGYSAGDRVNISQGVGRNAMTSNATLR